MPLHLPVFPQGAEGDAAGQKLATRGLLPAGMLTHIPTFPVTRQLWQELPHAPSQHTPSVQAPLLQSEFAPQAWPFGSLLPHRLSITRQV